jgi:hypothetical protein
MLNHPHAFPTDPGDGEVGSSWRLPPSSDVCWVAELERKTTDPRSALTYRLQGVGVGWWRAVIGKARAGGGNNVAHGGSIEVFTDPADAAKRGSFIQTFTQNLRIRGQEYGYAAGGDLLRVSGDLAPSHAGQYAKALTAIVAKPIVTPTPIHT